MSQNGFFFLVAKWQKSSTKKKTPMANIFIFILGVTQLSIIQEFYELLVYAGSMW
jgi:hypothetical protein